MNEFKDILNETLEEKFFKKHKPVLLEESINFLEIKKNGLYVDCTLGNGGHAKEIFKKLGDRGRLMAFELDKETIEYGKKNNFFPQNILIFNDNFANLDLRLEEQNIELVDGFLFDLGISSVQLESEERGFSYRLNSDLDMRISKEEDKSYLTAKEIVNNFSEKDLAEILFSFGEE